MRNQRVEPIPRITKREREKTFWNKVRSVELDLESSGEALLLQWVHIKLSLDFGMGWQA
jgi:hypothetical protein